jgi:hypothetical protein
MRITTEKQKPIRLYDWLKAKSISLKELIQKKNFNSYSDLILFCDKLGMLPCSEHDFNKSHEELYPPKVKEEITKPELPAEIETETNDEVSTIQESEITTQKQSKKKSSQPG